MAEIKYRKALDENNKVVDIEALSKEIRYLHKYRCISCEKNLLPRLGDIREHHFYHAVETDCNGETYLHNLAKHLLKKKFDESEHLYISYKANTVCNCNNCLSRNAECERYGEDSILIDLKKDYDLAVIEKKNKVNKDDAYKPDVLLSSSTNPDIKPIALEIFVTHKCSQEKLNSGLQIIEFKVKNEDDIDALIALNTYEESDKIFFHSFERNIKKDLSSKIFCHRLAKIRFKEKFEKSDHFYITYKADFVCDNESCMFRNKGCVRYNMNYRIDLKESYNSVNIIKSSEGINGDLLLTSNKSTAIPIVLNLFSNNTYIKSHQNSECQIINISIEDENDFEKVMNLDSIDETVHRITFHNFNKKIRKELYSTIFRYSLSDFGVRIENISCKKATHKSYIKSTVELNSAQKGPYGKNDIYFWELIHKNHKYCDICEYFDTTTRLCLKAPPSVAIYKNGNPFRKNYGEHTDCKLFNPYKDISEFDFYAEEVIEEKNVIQKTDVKIFIKNELTDYNLFRSKCDEIIDSEFKNNNVTIVCNENSLCNKYAMEYDLSIDDKKIIRDLFTPEEDVYQQELSGVDAVIVLWNGKNPTIVKFIEMAKNKGILLHIVNI